MLSKCEDLRALQGPKAQFGPAIALNHPALDEGEGKGDGWGRYAVHV